MGKPVIELAPSEAYRLWSSSYDASANPLLALETRLLSDWFPPLAGCRVIDVAAGTGRWAAFAVRGGANVIGVDLSSSMLAVAQRGHALRGRLAVADMQALPLADRSADLAVCSFALGYVESPMSTIAELARVARRVIVSDIHPQAMAGGWLRSFRCGGSVYRIRCSCHSLDSIDSAAKSAGLEKGREMEARFGEPEQQVFHHAGKPELYETARQVPAIFARCWERP